MLRFRLLLLFLAGTAAFCLIGLRQGCTQSTGLRRVTNTTEEGINLNPSISGDGRIVAFESTEDISAAGGADHFRALRADVSVEPATFFQIGGTRAVAPAISQDGSRIAFASKDDPLGTNADGNSEIFLFDGARLIQITNTRPDEITNRVTNGNFQPSMSDDGRFIAFSSNRDLVGQNADGNLEIFICDSLTNNFTQLTTSTGIVGYTDAKISGNGSVVAYIRDTGAAPSANRDLMIQGRFFNAPEKVLASQVQSLAMTYGRAISDDGMRVVYAGETATNSSQVFLFDGRGGNSTRQITSLGSRAADVPLHPTISGDGSRIAFATRRNVIGGNSDASVELYLSDLPSAQVSKITNAPSSATADVVSSLNDDGSIVAFNFPRVLSGAVSNSDLANNSEIYLTTTPVRPPIGTLTAILNGASFGNEPSTTKAIAPDSIAIARGGALANITQQSQRLSNGTFPTNVGGTTVTVNGRAAQIFFVSPGQINFLVPPQTEIGTADVVVTNPDGFPSREDAPTLRAAVGVFTKSGDGTGEGVILNSDTLQEGPFDPTSGNLRLTIFATGARNATQTLVAMGGRVVTADSVMASPDMPGLDEIHLRVPGDLRGAGSVSLFVQSDGRVGNFASVTFTGDAARDIVINEVLADPPGSLSTDLQGDANHDGVRSSADEFVELVNATSHDISIGGYQLLTRSSSTTTDTLRFTFATITILPACSAVVVFGGGNFDPNNPAFGGAQVFRTTTGLSLSNSGGVVTLRDSSNVVVNIFEYGGTTGLNGSANQSLTRSPDVAGAFTGHTTATGSSGHAFSPGTRVDGAPFAACPTVAQVDVSPASATIDAGVKQQFTARAFDGGGKEATGVIFSWQSSNTSVATIDQNGLASSSTAGSTEIRATGRGVQSGPAILTVREIQRVLTRIDVSPNSATVPATGAQQFTAHGFDQFGKEIAGLTFAWESTNTNAATIDQNGLASGVNHGQTTIRASSQKVTGTATLNVIAPTMIVNEVLADPPGSTSTDLQGDANHDGVRSATDDEFVELVNSTAAAINISGWTIRTHSTTSSTETLRHTFAANTTVAAGEAIVMFGGGNFNPNDGVFACAQVVKASSGGLSLTNSGLTILIRDSSDNLVTQFSYGGSTGLNGDNDQSLTRSPDVSGNFVEHTTATGAAGKRFSPGTRLNGAPFGNCPARLTSVTISPSSASVITGQSTQFNAQAFDQLGQPFTGATITFASDGANIATVDSVTTDPTAGTATATITGHNQGTAHITAQATGGSTTVTSSQATLKVNPPLPLLSIKDVSLNEGNNGTTTFTFTVSLSAPAPAGGVTFDIATQDGTASVTNNDYVSRSLTGQTIAAGNQTYVFAVVVNGDTVVEGNETFFVNVTNVIGANVADAQGQGTILNDDVALVVLSQIYGGGGNSGATYKNDFIELFNRGTTVVDLTGWSVQETSDAGSGTWSTTSVCVTGPCLLNPGRYFLVQEAAGSGGAQNLPTPDATGTISMSASAGKVALVSNTTALSGACPPSSSIIDLVGFGAAASCFEGADRAASPSNTTADFRKAGGCTDTNNNAADFFVSAPFPRNSSSSVNNCAGGATPNLTINDVTVTEGNSGTMTATFTVSLSAPAQGTDVTFDIATQDNTATVANNDYAAKSLTSQIIPAGQTTYSFSVRVNGDIAVEPDETFFVNVTNVSGASVADSQGIGTIQNDDFPTLSINDVSANEGDVGKITFTFTVSLSAPAPAPVTFDIASQDGTATVADNDYVAKGLSGQTIATGQQIYHFDVSVNGDTKIEPDENFFVNVTNVSGATVADGQGVGTILNDDSPVLSINDVTMNEGEAGTIPFIFTVTLSPASTDTVTVNYATADGTATAPGDYTAIATTLLMFAPSETTKQITVQINGDKLVEPNETLSVNLSGATNANVLKAMGVGTIVNDDTPLLVISQIYPGGGLTGATYQNDFVELFNRGTTTVDFSLTPFSVHFLSTGVTTWAKSDLTSGTIAPGRYFLIKEISGGGVGAALPTPDATGTINLTSTTAGKVALVTGTTLLTGNCPGDDGSAPFNPANMVDFVGYGGTASTTNHCYEGSGPASFTLSDNTIAAFRKAGGCTDTNDNAANFFISTPTPRNSSSPLNSCAGGVTPNLSINDVTVTEGNSGTTKATFTVSLSAPAQGTDVAFDIATADGTATTPNSDYIAKNLTNQIIPAGQTTYSFSVTVNGDTNVEPDETFFVDVSNVIGASVADGQGQGTIKNDDFPTLSINDVSANEGNSGTTTFNFAVSLSAPAPGPVTFDISTQDGTATTADNDYVARSLTGQTIATGQQTYNFAVTVNGDTNIEANETFFVNVTNVSGATILDGQGQGTIQNDDSPALSIDDVSANEGNSGTTTFTFHVKLSLPAGPGGVTFDIATQDGTATTVGSDYVAKSLTSQTIPAGSQSYNFDVTVNGDTLVENNETFFVNVTNVSGATTLDTQAQGMIQNDDTPLLVLSQVYGGGGNSGAAYQNDFVELFNRGTTTVDFSVTSYSVQYASSSVSFSSSNKVDLTTGTMAPGQYFLIKLASTAAVGQTFTADITKTSIDMNATNGKVALVLGTTVATTTSGCPTGVTVADLLGYGTANCAETTTTAALSATKVDLRKSNGCTDTGNNSSDFTVTTVNTSSALPRNSSSALAPCP